MFQRGQGKNPKRDAHKARLRPNVSSAEARVNLCSPVFNCNGPNALEAGGGGSFRRQTAPGSGYFKSRV